jgi:hypothetical protein
MNGIRVLRTIALVAIGVGAFAYLAILAFAPSAAPLVEPVQPLGVVECWDDATCSDGSSLDEYFCGRQDYYDRGRLVRSDGVCTAGQRADD